MFSKKDVDELKESIKRRLSEKRYKHTLGVAEMAVRLGEYLLPGDLERLYLAGLLHDVAKEMSKDEVGELLKDHPDYLGEDDLLSPDIIHSLIAPLVIKRDFPAFADEKIMTAVYDHTLGSEDMDVFSEIIFISDFIEMGRTYDACIRVRDMLLDGLYRAKTYDERLRALKCAIFLSLDFTVSYITEKKGFIHPKSILARNSYKAFI